MTWGSTSNESTRILDDRLSFNLLLGFHVIGFKSASAVAYRLGVPQGFELIARDVVLRRWNMGIGGFFIRRSQESPITMPGSATGPPRSLPRSTTDVV
jgi:hypothetical protein